MKKFLITSFLCTVLFTLSCTSDDNSSTKENPIVSNPDTPGTDQVKVLAEWVPSTIKINSLIPISIPTMDYPHTEGCTKDYLQLKSDDTAKFFRYEGANCAVTEFDQAFVRKGNDVSLNVMGYTISGTIKTENSTTMVIESDITQYSEIIKVLYPEYSQYLALLTGAKVELQLDKK